MTEPFGRDRAAIDRIEDLLEAYADARYSASGPVLARMRRHVLAQAARRAAVTPADANRVRRHRLLPELRLPRKVFALAGAVVLPLTMAIAVLGAPPNSPFYNARVALQEASLPSQADARLAGHENLLGERLAEAEAAATSGDQPSLAAALGAYDAEVDHAVADAGDDRDRLSHLEKTLSKHVAVLTALVATAPGHASIDSALDNSQNAIAKIKAKGAHSGAQPDGKPGPHPDGNPDERHDGKPASAPGQDR